MRLYGGGKEEEVSEKDFRKRWKSELDDEKRNRRLRGMQGQGGGMLGAGRACIKALRWETVYLLLLEFLGRQAADETGIMTGLLMLHLRTNATRGQ